MSTLPCLAEKKQNSYRCNKSLISLKFYHLTQSQKNQTLYFLNFYIFIRNLGFIDTGWGMLTVKINVLGVRLKIHRRKKCFTCMLISKKKEHELWGVLRQQNMPNHEFSERRKVAWLKFYNFRIEQWPKAYFLVQIFRIWSSGTNTE